MSGILSVVPAFLNVLAGVHDEVSGLLGGAAKVPSGLGSSVQTTHGTMTQNFNTKVQEFETQHLAAGQGMQGVAGQLAGNLRKAFGAYTGTDKDAAGLLDKIFG